MASKIFIQENYFENVVDKMASKIFIQENYFENVVDKMAAKIFIQENYFENGGKMGAILPRGRCVFIT